MRYAIMIGLVLLGAVAYAAVDAVFHVKPVLSYEDVVACGAKGGRGAFVFSLDAEGNPTSEEAPYCITEVK